MGHSTEQDLFKYCELRQAQHDHHNVLHGTQRTAVNDLGARMSMVEDSGKHASRTEPAGI